MSEQTNMDDYNNYNQHDNITYEDTPNDTVNILDVNDPKHQQMYQKRMLEGRSFRAPSTNEIPDDVWESWRTSFMSGIRDDPKGISKVFKYVWYNDEEALDNSTARFGVAKDVDQIVKMIQTGQIKREEITYKGNGHVDNHPSKTAWAAVGALTNADYRLVKEEIKDAQGGVVSTLEPLENNKVDILDCIVVYLTGDFYSTKYTEGGKVTRGGPLKEYFANYDEIFKALRAAHEEGVNCVPLDMIDSFKDGVYCNYNTVMKAMKRRYNRCRTHETLMDWFRKIDKIVEMRCPMEFKVQKLRSTLKKIFLTGTSFPTCADFPGDRLTQVNPDEFTPSMAMLVGYILFDKLIPRNSWDKIQKEFYHEIEGKATYENWHKNRLELWRKMDDEIRSKNKSNVARNINSLASDNLQIDPNDVNAVMKYLKTRQNNQQQQQRQSGNRFGRGQPLKPKPRQFAQKETIPNRLRKYLCRHCSSVAGKNMYHEGGFGGGPDSKCPYDRNGRQRKDKNGKPYKFIRSIEGLGVDNIPVDDYRHVFNINDTTSVDEGLEYEDDEDFQDQMNLATNQLLQEALGQDYSGQD